MLQHHILFQLLLALLISGCSNSSGSHESIQLARVGDQILTLEEALEQIPGFILEQDTLNALENFQGTWVNNKISEQEAMRIGLHETPSIRNRIERMESQILQRGLEEYIINRNNEDFEVTREEAHNYYQAHRDQFILDERFVRFRHLTTRTRVEAERARTDLMQGDPWEDVARRYSIDPDYQIRVSESFFPVSAAVADIPEMNSYLNNLIGITELSPVREFDGRYHFVQLTDARDAGDHPDLEWLIEQITEWLILEKTQRVVNSYIRNLYLQAEANNEIEQLNVEEMLQTDVFKVTSTDNK